MASRHEVRMKRGKRKGQFAKKTVVDARENLIQSVASKRQKEIENSACVLPRKTRIVDIATLAKELWCNTCNIPLSLRNLINEWKCGMASVLHVKCVQCQTIHVINTNERSGTNAEIKYFINAEAALGMIDAGIGETHVNTFLSAMNIPTYSPQLLKKHERIVGPIIEEVAKESCVESIRLEKEKTMEVSRMKIEVSNDSVAVENKEPCRLKVSFDAGWQKRGTGHSYNSLSGHATVAGHYSGKILSYAVRSSKCRKCSLGRPTSDHDCRRNYSGSAKGMEPDMAMELINNNVLFNNENVIVHVLIGDDDSSTIAAVRRLSNNEIEKWSDFNHTHKTLTGALYSMKLSPKLIEYFSHNFSHAIKQNKDNPEKVKNALQCIVPHAFGDHLLCGDWCSARSSENGYSHKNLPNGKHLENPDLRIALTQLFSRFSNNADRIANCGSTQKNEAANNVVASKNPKSRYYSDSESLNFRVSAAVCQINIGCKYVETVYEKMKHSLGEEAAKFRTKKDYKRLQKAINAKSINIKKKRLQLKKARASKSRTASQKEGITYESGVSLNHISSTFENFNRIRNFETNYTDCKIIIFDLETTGFHKNDQICQIAACTKNTTFNVYITPSRQISKGAFEVTGLQMIDGDLYHHELKLESFSATVAFQKFLKYLTSLQSPVIMAAHNGFRFDVPRLLALATKIHLLDDLKMLVKGFADTLIISKMLLPQRSKEKKKFTIAALAHDFLPYEKVNNLHNAVNDVIILQKIMHKIDINDDIIKKQSKSIEQILSSENIKNLQFNAKISLQEYSSTISKAIINKMAMAGITKNILQETFQQHGYDGLRILLSESVNGKARITTNKKILEKIYQLF